jgi:hypothetical protein
MRMLGLTAVMAVFAVSALADGSDRSVLRDVSSLELKRDCALVPQHAVPYGSHPVIWDADFSDSAEVSRICTPTYRKTPATNVAPRYLIGVYR